MSSRVHWVCECSRGYARRQDCELCRCCGCYDPASPHCVKCQEQARAGALKLHKRAMTKRAASGSLLMRAPPEVLAKLWAPPEPAMHNQGLAVDLEVLLRRLDTDPAFAERYWNAIGAPYRAESEEVPELDNNSGDSDDDDDEDDDDDKERRPEGQSGA